jgi:PAS domain S-box-containing protein
MRYEDKRKFVDGEVFRTLAETASDAILTIDEEDNILFANGAAERIFGYTVREMVGQKLEMLMPEKLRKAHQDSIKLYIKTGKRHIPWEAVETYGLHKSGKQIPLEISFGEFYKNGNHFFTGIVRDETERIRAEEEKKKIQAQLLRAQKLEAMGTLAGGVAHDFNNLLTAIRGYAELAMLQVGRKDPLYKDLKEIVLAVERASELTSKLLLFGRKQPVALSPVNINGTVEDLLELVKSLIGEGIKIKTDLERGLWAASADEGSIEQVLMNLAVNARDAMHGGGKLTIKTENVTLDEEGSKAIPESRPGKFVLISVADTGAGMDKDTFRHIFEPFFTTKGVGRGTGLGLSVVYGIVKQHEGWINVKSEPGKGSTFNVYLPATSEKKVEETKEAVSLKGLRGRGERILLVEDEEGVRKFSARALSENGYVVSEATNAKQALSVFEREKGGFNLVLTDAVLPDMRGLLLVDRLLSVKPALRVLLSSGYGEDRLQWNVIRERGFRFLKKPFAVTELLEAVREAVT